jgi:hypothetical protein
MRLNGKEQHLQSWASRVKSYGIFKNNVAEGLFAKLSVSALENLNMRQTPPGPMMKEMMWIMETQAIHLSRAATTRAYQNQFSLYVIKVHC